MENNAAHNQELFTQLLRKLDITPKKLIFGDKNNKFFVQAGLQIHHPVLIKFAVNDERKKVEGFQKEKLVEDLLCKYPGNNQFNRAKVIGFGQNDEYAWLIREYIDGECLGNYDERKDSILFGYDDLNSKFKDKYENVIDQLKNSLNFLIQIKEKENPRHNFKQRFPLELSPENIEKIEKFRGNDLKNVIDFYEKKKDDYFVHFSAVTSDLIPSNLFYNKGRVYFSDFEWFCFDNYLLDATYLWLFLWRYPQWQKAIEKQFLLTESDKIDFKLNLIRIIINCPWHERIINRFSNEEDFPWYDYLRKADKLI